MKVAIMIVAAAVLAGCGSGWMSLEEYNARVKWCTDHNLQPEVTYSPLKGGSHHPNPTYVNCRDGNGNLFQSEYK